MFLHQLTPWPWLMPRLPEVSDEELAAVPGGDVNGALVAILRQKRAPEVWHRMSRIKKDIETAMVPPNDQRDIATRAPSRQRQAASLNELHMMASNLMLLYAPKIEHEEIRELMARWLSLRFRPMPAAIEELEGRQIVNGIIQPVAGRP